MIRVKIYTGLPTHILRGNIICGKKKSIHLNIEVIFTILHTKREKVSERDWNWLKSPTAERLNGGGLRSLTHNPFLQS